MLDVITSFNVNCYSPLMDWRNEINYILPNDISFFIYLFVFCVTINHRSALRVTRPRSFNPERPFCFVATATDHVHSYYRYISQWRHARSFERVSHSDVTFSQLYTPCSSETKDVITSKCHLADVSFIEIGLSDSHTLLKSVKEPVPMLSVFHAWFHICALHFPCHHILTW
jgi:hypothetical protein